MSSGDVLRFGPFRLDARSRELRRDGVPVPLRPKTFALLRFLAENPERLLTKDEILDAVWSDVAVGDAVLKVGIRELREALGDEAATPQFIETAHRLGYRFVAPVESHGLPERLTSFVGREAELHDLGETLGETRLLTLIGPGGSGKTRLALELARSAAARYPDGLWWVELAPITNPDLVPTAVATAIGVRSPRSRSLVDALVGALRGRRTLLVLDNCEHLVSGVADLAGALLRGAGELTILATSREPLSVEGEAPWLVPPLSIPAEEGAADAQASEAVRLFVERIGAPRADRPWDAETAGAVTRICRRLDGMPLAIELAAARARVLSVADVASRLDDCFRLLGGGHRDVPRHQTLRTAIDWSHDLLEPDERTLLRRLSVFVGPFTLEAIEAVCDLPPLASDSLADLLARLVDKSLVAAGPEPGRYRLLEIVRQYAAAKLAASREGDAVASRHTICCLATAERLAAGVNGPGRRAILARFGADVGNLRTALRRALDARDGVLAHRLVAALVWFWFHAGHWNEARRALDEALALEAPDGDPGARAMALFGAGLIAWTQGDPAVARERLEASVDGFRRCHDDAGRGYALLFLAATEVSLGEYRRARELALESTRLFRDRTDEPFGRAAAATNLGIVLLAGGETAQAEASLEDGLAIARESGDEWVAALALRNLGLLDSRRGELLRAVARLRESVVVLRDGGERWFLSRSFESLAGVLARQGSLEAAARLYGAGEALRETIGASILPFYRPDYEGGLDILRVALAPDTLEALWQEGRRLRVGAATEYALSVTVAGTPGRP